MGRRVRIGQFSNPLWIASARNSRVWFRFRPKFATSSDLALPGSTFAASVAGAHRKIYDSTEIFHSNSFGRTSPYRARSFDPLTTQPARLPFDRINRRTRIANYLPGPIRLIGFGAENYTPPQKTYSLRESWSLPWQDRDCSGTWRLSGDQSVPVARSLRNRIPLANRTCGGWRPRACF
jgi:hypothetical protein